MMKVLHIFPKDDHTNARYVALLAKALPESIESLLADDPVIAKKMCKDHHPDIVHIYGNGRYEVTGRRVISPCGTTFDPQQSYYAVIARSPLEAESLFEQEVKRVEIIRNPLVTKTASFDETAQKMAYVYQKVMDSNTLEQMNKDSELALAAIIKASITGDRRWLDGTQHLLFDTKQINWRHLLVYAEHENIRNYIDYGINILGLSTPLIETKQINAYFPDYYTKPLPIKELIGDYNGNENDYLMRIIRQINKQPLLLHLIELTRELYRNTVNDEQLIDLLEEKSLASYTARLMQIIQEQTLIDEGFMPITPIDDKQTKHIRNLLTNHLKI
jgi:hypothetical protein